MTRSELTVRLAAHQPQHSAADCAQAIKSILDALGAALATGERVEIRGFGSFSVNLRSPRTARNPKTGDVVLVPAKGIPHFRAGKELRKRVDARA